MADKINAENISVNTQSSIRISWTKIQELSAISCDVALVPIGGFFTMNAEEAAKLINSIRPHVAIPTHYGSIVGKMRDAEIFGENIEQGIAVEIKIR